MGIVATVASVASAANNILGGGGGGGGGGQPQQQQQQQSQNSSSNPTGTNQMFVPLSPQLTAGSTAPINLIPSMASSQLYNADVPLSFSKEGGAINLAGGGLPEPSLDHKLSQGESLGSISLIGPHFKHFERLLSEEPLGTISTYSTGGHAEHVPEFYSQGGLKNTYVQGAGDGTSDSVPAMLANGEFVIPADVVSSLGNGSNDSGSKVLDEFLKTIREHKAKHSPSQLPPDSKGTLEYLAIAKHKTGGA